ncbi:MAG: TRAP transporter substrate-binding protein DctP [Burkholderiales bacterium]
MLAQPFRRALLAAAALIAAAPFAQAQAQAPIVIKFSHVVSPDTPKGKGAERFKHHVADFKGLKMRIQSSQVIEANMRALGALPQVMSFSELYQGLLSGVVDGSENTPSNDYTQKVYEVQKHITVSNHGHISYAMIVNKKFWEGLPADIRTTLEGAMKDATTYANAIAETENRAAKEKMAASGKTTIYTLTPAETAEWKNAMYVVHEEMEDHVGKDTIQAVYKASGYVVPK